MKEKAKIVKAGQNGKGSCPCVWKKANTKASKSLKKSNEIIRVRNGKVYSWHVCKLVIESDWRGGAGGVGPPF